MNDNLEKNTGMYEVITIVVVLIFLVFIFVKFLYF
jgi:hypothetical protein